MCKSILQSRKTLLFLLLLLPHISSLTLDTLETLNVTYERPPWSPFDYHGWAIVSGVLLGVVISLIALLLGIVFFCMLLPRCCKSYRKSRIRRRIRPSSGGDVVFAFTDVLESTALHNLASREMLSSLHLHDEVTRRTLRQFGGSEVKTIGDSFMVSFSDPYDAIRWACALQYEMLYVGWPEGLLRGAASGICRPIDRTRVKNENVTPPPSAIQRFFWRLCCCFCILCCRNIVCCNNPITPQHPNEGRENLLLYRGLTIRIGLHIGSEFRCHVDRHTKKHDFLGPTVNRTARVESVTPAGETFITQALLEKVRDRLVDDGSLKFREAGKFVLKGFQGEHVMYSVLDRRLEARWKSDFGDAVAKSLEMARRTGAIEGEEREGEVEYTRRISSDQAFLALQRVRRKMRHSDELVVQSVEN